MRVVSSSVFETSLPLGSVRRVRGEVILTGYCGCVRCAFAAHDYGNNVDLGTRPGLSNSIDEGGVFIASQLCGVREV
jgi:hypothetical protein